MFAKSDHGVSLFSLKDTGIGSSTTLQRISGMENGCLRLCSKTWWAAHVVNTLIDWNFVSNTDLNRNIFHG